MALLLCAAIIGVAAAPSQANELTQRKVILENSKVTVSLQAIAPGDATPMHRHDKDLIAVYVNGGKSEHTMQGKEPVTEKIEDGEVRFSSGGFSHSRKNLGTEPFRAVIVEFAEPQGKLEKLGTKSKTCAPDKNVCLEEKKLFCLEKVCVENVSMAPGSMSIKHTHATDHILIAISDFELTDQVEGKGTVVRKLKSGEVEYIPAGITHQLTNTGKEAARFAVIVWK